MTVREARAAGLTNMTWLSRSESNRERVADFHLVGHSVQRDPGPLSGMILEPDTCRSNSAFVGIPASRRCYLLPASAAERLRECVDSNLRHHSILCADLPARIAHFSEPARAAASSRLAECNPPPSDDVSEG
jgi:hypothetical protein